MLPIVERYLQEQYKLTKHKNIFVNSKRNIYYSSDVLNVSLKKIIKRCNIKDRTLYALGIHSLVLCWQMVKALCGCHKC